MDWLDIKEFFSDTFKYFLVVIFVLLVIVYVFTFTQVVGPSMEPTLEAKNITVLSKSHYQFFEVKRGDIIAFEYNGMRNLVKRVIGLPGETVEFKDNVLYINGQEVKEPYIKNEVTKDYVLKKPSNVIPEDMYFVVGDNRDDSLDSRVIGLIDKKDISGKIVMRLFPFSEIKLVK